MPAESDTAPASTSSCGVAIELTVDLSEFDRVKVTELVPFVVMVPLERVTPPELWPDSRMWNLVATCFEESSASLNVIFSVPSPVLYAAEENVGRMVSSTARAWSATADMGLLEESNTAPASMSIWGVAIAAKAVRCVGESVAVSVGPDTVTADRVMPPADWPVFRMCILEAIAEDMASLNVIATDTLPLVYEADTNVGFVVSITVMAKLVVAFM